MLLLIAIGVLGVFSALGQDHKIAAPMADGSVDSAGRRAQVRVRTTTLRVRNPNASDKDREETQRTGPYVLDVERFAEIAFRSTAAEQTGPGTWTARGDLTLHGQTGPIAVAVQDQSGHYVGSRRA